MRFGTISKYEYKTQTISPCVKIVNSINMVANHMPFFVIYLFSLSDLIVAYIYIIYNRKRVKEVTDRENPTNLKTILKLLPI